MVVYIARERGMILGVYSSATKAVRVAIENINYGRSKPLRLSIRKILVDLASNEFIEIGGWQEGVSVGRYEVE